MKAYERDTFCCCCCFFCLPVKALSSAGLPRRPSPGRKPFRSSLPKSYMTWSGTLRVQRTKGEAFEVAANGFFLWMGGVALYLPQLCCSLLSWLKSGCLKWCRPLLRQSVCPVLVPWPGRNWNGPMDKFNPWGWGRKSPRTLKSKRWGLKNDRGCYFSPIENLLERTCLTYPPHKNDLKNYSLPQIQQQTIHHAAQEKQSCSKVNTRFLAKAWGWKYRRRKENCELSLRNRQGPFA